MMLIGDRLHEIFAHFNLIEVCNSWSKRLRSQKDFFFGFAFCLSDHLTRCRTIWCCRWRSKNIANLLIYDLQRVNAFILFLLNAV